jgi:hypothetical protein
MYLFFMLILAALIVYPILLIPLAVFIAYCFIRAAAEHEDSTN